MVHALIISHSTSTHKAKTATLITMNTNSVYHAGSFSSRVSQMHMGHWNGNRLCQLNHSTKGVRQAVYIYGKIKEFCVGQSPKVKLSLYLQTDEQL